MTSILPKTRILYVWVPYAVFLLAIFIILAVSFVKHTKRVFRRRQILMDYIEANVLSERPRLCRMFSPSLKTGQETKFLRSSSGFHPPKDLPGAYIDERGRFPPGQVNCLRGSVRRPRVPVLTSTDVARNKHYGLEDSGQSVWFQNNLMFGHNNLAFRFDEDLGRHHARQFMYPQQNHIHMVMPRESSIPVRHCSLPYMDVIESERESQQSFGTGASPTTSPGTCSANSTSYDTISRAEVAYDQLSQRRMNFAGEKRVDQGFEPSAAGMTPSKNCPHCGSSLPVKKFSSNKRAKKRPRHRQQSACSDSCGGNSEELESPLVPHHGNDEIFTAPKKQHPPSETDSHQSFTPGGLSESCSTYMTTLSTNSRTTVSTPWTVSDLKSSRCQAWDGDVTAKNLQVYTIEMNLRTPNPQLKEIRKSSLPESEPASSSARGDNKLRPTTTASLKRCSSACLPADNGQSTLGPCSSHVVVPLSLEKAKSPPSAITSSSSPRNRSSLTSSTSLSSPTPGAVDTTTEEDSVFCLSGNSEIHQTVI